MKKLSQHFRDGKTGLDFFLPSKTKVYEDNTVGIIFLGDRIPKTLVKTSGIFWWHGVRWLTNGSLGWCMRWLTPHFTVKRFSDPVRKTSQKSKKNLNRLNSKSISSKTSLPTWKSWHSEKNVWSSTFRFI